MNGSFFDSMLTIFTMIQYIVFTLNIRINSVCGEFDFMFILVWKGTGWFSVSCVYMNVCENCIVSNCIVIHCLRFIHILFISLFIKHYIFKWRIFHVMEHDNILFFLIFFFRCLILFHCILRMKLDTKFTAAVALCSATEIDCIVLHTYTQNEICKKNKINFY